VSVAAANPGRVKNPAHRTRGKRRFTFHLDRSSHQDRRNAGNKMNNGRRAVGMLPTVV